MDTWRGHPIEEGDYGVWCYVDTGQPVYQNADRPCGHCGRENTVEGHDGCLGVLPGVLNACCGHGVISSAYIVLDTGERLGGKIALAWASQQNGGG